MLSREVQCSGELRLGRPSRASVFADSIGIVFVKICAATAGCVVLVVVLGCVIGPRVIGCRFSETKVDVAKFTVKKYAFEAFPSWAAAHPDRDCPAMLEELNEYMNNKDIKDPWGRNYKMLCGATLPRGAKGLAVMSPGEDRRFGTGDDIKSWD